MISSFPLKNRLILFILMVLSTIMIGSLGYVLIKIFVEHESVTFTDAIYFSVVTISTLGYYPSGVSLHSEIGKWFTIFYLIFGLGVIFGGIQALLGPWIELKVKNAVQDKKMPVPQDAHVIIAGYNDVADIIMDELDFLDIPFVIVDENAPVDRPSVYGKPTEMENLIKANIGRAKALVAIGDNEMNAVTVITGRKLNDKLNIIALSHNDSAKGILKKCGATVVVSRDELIGSVLSHWIKNDFVHKFAGEIFKDMVLEEQKVDKCAGKSIMELNMREKKGLIIGIYRDGQLLVNPQPEIVLKKGDILLVFKGGV